MVKPVFHIMETRRGVDAASHGETRPFVISCAARNQAEASRRVVRKPLDGLRVTLTPTTGQDAPNRSNSCLDTARIAILRLHNHRGRADRNTLRRLTLVYLYPIEHAGRQEARRGFCEHRRSPAGGPDASVHVRS
jgi:hypothetical protein